MGRSRTGRVSPPIGLPRDHDRGFTFVELLVSIVLIGTAVLATLVGLRATIVASAVNDDRAHLVAWLQEGVEAIHRTPYVDCDPDETVVLPAYQAAIVPAAVPPPSGWSGGSLTVDEVRFATVHANTYVERWATDDCDYPARTAQLLTITATSPDGSMSETVQVVLDG